MFKKKSGDKEVHGKADADDKKKKGGKNKSSKSGSNPFANAAKTK